MKRALMAAAAMVFCSSSLLSAQPTAPVETIPEAPGGILTYVTCQVGLICDIPLDPGEKLTATAMGDNFQWQIGQLTDQNQDRQHVILRPLDSGNRTNLIITTDRRYLRYFLESPASEKEPGFAAKPFPSHLDSSGYWLNKYPQLRVLPPLPIKREDKK